MAFTHVFSERFPFYLSVYTNPHQIDPVMIDLRLSRIAAGDLPWKDRVPHRHCTLTARTGFAAA